MNKSILYVFGGGPKPETITEIKNGLSPEIDFFRFCARTGAKLVSAAEVFGAERNARRRFFQDAEIIITTGEDVGYKIAFSAMLQRRFIPVLIIFHGHSMYSPRNRLIISVLKRLKHIHWLTLSTSLRDQLISDMKIPESRCHATGYPTDTEFFTPSGEAETPLIASAGAANRDFATLVAATRDIPVPVRIAADSAWFPEPASFGPAGLPDHIQARSYGNYPNLRDLYASASMVIVPLRPARHACGYAVIAEGMAMGKPVIATKTETPSDLIVHGETGYYVEAGNVEELKKYIEILLADPALARKMGAASRARMVEKFSLDAWCSGVEAVVNAL